VRNRKILPSAPVNEKSPQNKCITMPTPFEV